jgi:endonuclease/exonuclease/phosphatase family metal-dependent hydrolase
MGHGWLPKILIVVALAIVIPLPDNRSCETFPLVERSFAAAPAPPTGRLTIATLNMAEETDLETVIRGLGQSDPLREADVLLLQEVVYSEARPADMPASLARRLGYWLVFAPADSVGHATRRGLAILSRLPLRDAAVVPLPRNSLGFKSRCRIGLGVTVEDPQGPLRIFNVHFDSRINTAGRLRQLQPILESAAAFAGPRVIGGDFNTANFLWIRHLLPLPYVQFQARAVREALRAEGYATPFENTGRTFSYLPLKLDWIFFKELQILDAGVASIPFSDHHGLWATVRRGR